MYSCIKEDVEYIFSDITNNQNTSQWLVANFSNWEPNTFKVFKHVLEKKDSNKTVIDIGAWIGLTAIWLSKKFNKVICIEADKDSVISLKNNLESSNCNNVIVINKAIYNTNTQLIFGVNTFRENATLNDSTSQLKQVASNTNDYLINTIVINDILQYTNASELAFIKVDIEGGEEHILEQLFEFCSKHSLDLFVSFHISWWTNKDITRFSNLFNNATIKNDNLDIIDNCIEYLQSQPFGSLLFEF